VKRRVARRPRVKGDSSTVVGLYYCGRIGAAWLDADADTLLRAVLAFWVRGSFVKSERPCAN
jgi:hypothetical protein